MSLPPAARWYLRGVVLAAAMALSLSLPALLHVRPQALLHANPLVAVELVLLAIAAQHFPLMVAPRWKFDVSIGAQLALVLLVDPPLGALLAGASELIGQGTMMLRRHPKTGQPLRRLPGTLFNASQMTLACAAAGAVNAVAGHPFGPALAATTLYLVNSGLVAVMAALHRGESPLAVWLSGRTMSALQAGCALVLGMLTAHSAALDPWVPVVMVLPAAITYVALKRTAGAEEAVRLRDEFLSVAAHELRTPLTSLRGYAQLLRRDADRDGDVDRAKLRRGTRVLDEQATRLCGLVDQVLDLSRIESGKLAIERAPLDLAALAAETAEALAPLAAPYALHAIAAAPVIVEADRVRLTQVVTNLVTNAVRYARGGDSIEIEAGCAGSTAWIAVRDHGVGVPEGHRDQIFERFHQADRSGKGGGLGIGLYVAREIAELHGGALRLESPADGGARFVLSLPLAQVSVTRQPTPEVRRRAVTAA